VEIESQICVNIRHTTQTDMCVNSDMSPGVCLVCSLRPVLVFLCLATVQLFYAFKETLTRKGCCLIAFWTDAAQRRVLISQYFQYYTQDVTGDFITQWWHDVNIRYLRCGWLSFWCRRWIMWLWLLQFWEYATRKCLITVKIVYLAISPYLQMDQ
jgi:hypothetical protein